MKTKFDPVEKIKASEQVADMLLKSILQGEIRPGNKLPPERVLATQFSVTRTTLREALKKLEQLKLIVIRQGQGIIVEDFHNASIDLLFYLLKVDGAIDLKILENILEARELFGTDVVRLAAKRADENDIKQMSDLMANLVKATDPATLQQLDFEFFRLLALASKNMVYILLMNTIKVIHDKHLKLFLPLSLELNTSIQQQILEAVRNGDEEKAAKKAGEFLQTGIELLKFFKSTSM
ncbi:MAG: FadR family transcriptional regulator [Desulfobacterales bacterium]|nr:FadR family transcriptional regulator [Desulfobacterales bacterium]